MFCLKHVWGSFSSRRTSGFAARWKTASAFSRAFLT